MACCCQSTALRLFLNSLAQVHGPARAATSRLSQNQSLYNALRNPPRRVRSSQRATFPLSTPQSRLLHTSTVRKGSAEAVRAVQDDVDEGRTPEDTTVLAEVASRRERLPPNITFHDSETAQRTEADERNSETRKGEPGEEKPKSKKKKKKAKKDQTVKDDEQPDPPKEKEHWMIQKKALKEKFPEGWNPRKKLSPDAMTGIRALHAQFPEEYTTEVLANKFEVSPEAIRRILKSKWTPSPEEEEERQQRWFNRGKRVWAHWAELGKKPPKKWRAEGIVRDPKWNRPRGPVSKPAPKKVKEEREHTAEVEWRIAEDMVG